MDFFDKTGKMAIGSRLRMLADKVTEEAAQIYGLYGLEIKPKWFPVFFVLSHGESKTITAIAKEIGHTHPSVCNIVKEMSARGFVTEGKDKTDGRKNVVSLSVRGMEMAETLAEQCADVEAVIEQMSRQTRNDLWRAIGEWEYLLSERSLFRRVKEEKQKRERKELRIVSFEPCYQQAFRDLNEEWITSHWRLEEHDYEVLDHPQEHILEKGGHIFVALYKDVPVGVCALCKLDDPLYDYELAKLAVSPSVQGKGFGLLLCGTVIEKAKELGAKKIFLESNTLLKPAIHIYRKLGFKELAEYHPAYERGDIQMELSLV